jgi:hypothetical protein
VSGLRFECTRCGACCTNRGEYAHVYVNADEVRELAGELGMRARDFRRAYTFLDEDGWTQLTVSGGACALFDPEQRSCRAYGARPAQCRTFPFWREMVQDGEFTAQVARLCEGVGRGRLYSIEYAEARMRELDDAEER